jgi:hypothetical protein
MLSSSPSAIPGASGWGNIELIGYHHSRGPGGDSEDKGEDEEKFDHGAPQRLPLHPGWQRRLSAPHLI